MEICKTVGIIFLILYSLIFLRLSIIPKKPIKQFVLNTAASLWFWAVLNLTSFFTTLYIPFNIYSLLSVTFGGIPFTVLLAVSKIFIF